MSMEQIKQLTELYYQNPRKFSNNYMSGRKAHDVNNNLYKFSLLVDEYIIPIKNKFNYSGLAETFFNIKNNYPEHFCRKCGKITPFHHNCYRSYCCVNCSRSDPTKTSEEMYKVAAEKRKVKMQEILNDPIKGKEYRRKISEKSKIYNNLPEVRANRSKAMKERIRSGRWTPCITSKYTHWSICINGKKFRSSFEGIFYIYHNLYKNDKLQYEKVRIKYKTDDNKDHVYIVDFYDFVNKILYEIKPESEIHNNKNMLKAEAARDWCKQNDHKYVFICEDELKSYFKEMVDSGFTHKFFDEFKKVYTKW